MGIIYDDELRFADAIREYQKALELEPDSSYVHTRLGADYILAREDKKAVEELVTAKSLDTSDTRPRFLLAVIYTSLGRFEDARREYEEVLLLEPESLWALGSLADILVLQKKLDEAAGVYEKMLKAHRDSSVLHFNLGAIYEQLKQKEDAARQFRETIRLDPDFADAYNYLGYMFAEDGVNLDEAEALIKKALELEPANGAFLDSLGWVYFKKGMFGDAEREIERAIKSLPDDPTILDHREKVKEKLKK